MFHCANVFCYNKGKERVRCKAGNNSNLLSHKIWVSCRAVKCQNFCHEMNNSVCISALLLQAPDPPRP